MRVWPHQAGSIGGMLTAAVSYSLLLVLLSDTLSVGGCVAYSYTTTVYYIHIYKAVGIGARARWTARINETLLLLLLLPSLPSALAIPDFTWPAALIGSSSTRRLAFLWIFCLYIANRSFVLYLQQSSYNKAHSICL